MIAVASLWRRAYARVLRPKNLDAVQYWEDRARTYGRRSVLNLSHDESEFREVTAKQQETLFPLLLKQLRGNEKLILDFGCGPGRFTTSLAQMTHMKVVGVDPIKAFLRWAPRHPDVSYRQLVGSRIPVDTNSVDVLWVCLVLGAISGEALEPTIREFNRVLREDGVLFLVENTAEKPNGKFWKFRTIKHYQSLVTFCEMSHLSDYEDVGERISIFAGRKHKQSHD